MKRICLCCFSPCHNVRDVVSCMGETLASLCHVPLEWFDFTLPQSRQQPLTFGPEDLVLLGCPVYAGRVPNKIMPYIRDSIRGNGAKGVAVVAFGNRSFDDALSELRLLMTQNGFSVTAAAAVVTEHSFAPELAHGRPDEADRQQYADFAQKVACKLQQGGAPLTQVPGAEKPEAYYTPLKEDGTPARFLKATPQTDLQRCTHCGACAAACPMGSVDAAHPEQTTGVCIKCQACIHVCEQGARCFTDADFLSHRQMLRTHYIRPAQSVFCL